MREGALIGPIIVAIGLVMAGIAVAVVGALLQTADGSTELRLERAEAETSQLRAQIDTLRSELRDAQAELKRLAEEVALGTTTAPMPQGNPGLTLTAPTPDLEQDEVQAPTEAMTEVMKLAKARFNKGISQPRNRVMLDVLGAPRSTKTVNCSGVTQPHLKALLETRQVGPIRVTMLKPALESLERIVAQLKESEPEIYEALGTAGALCARLIRGSSSSWSNHSWGTAIDVKLQGRLDGFGDGGTQFGLLLLAELFNEEGWYWGATYNREDSMHFEVGVETLRKWQAEGKL
ncbi:M15 family metallopeptidase [Lentibacter algarum]|uniref:M15 family metallopeptidase n=1 Tax=Lentibacter algarum TaxID=576131 RepID=UPI001C07BDA7|nr:M15 family metallopeptidase [Lentibacter algarum]MBU2980576.1 M15 family metallopeptidase [Lentibacter algarum]